MQSFFLKLIVFLLLVGGPYYYLQKHFMMREDAFYWKATQRADHLIIGCSRACHGIHPSVLEEQLGLSETMVNFAFNVNASPYGEPYYRAIQRKLSKVPSGKGIYILSVAPANVMDYSRGKGEREKSFRFYKLWAMNAKPNMEYIFRQPRPGQALLVNILERRVLRQEPEKYALPDGAQYNVGKKTSKDNWRKHPPGKTLVQSNDREHYLKRTVDLLAARGHVFLVRLPVSESKMSEENRIYPNFDQVMEDLAASSNRATYLNYNDTLSTAYSYYDAVHHLDGESARLFSRDLARVIGLKLKINEF